jgi:hypothetical protein
METEFTMDELIDNLQIALDRYIGSSPDHAAMEAARDLKKLLSVDPEAAANEIGNLFDGPKTVITDSFASEKTIVARNKVSEARRPLGSHFAKQRRLNREKRVNKAINQRPQKNVGWTQKAIAFMRRLWRR